jgi:hypothetical protein
MATGYKFWKAPTNGLPEYTSGGYSVSVIPGFGQWVLLGPFRDKRIAEEQIDTIPVEDVVAFLESRGNR